MDTSKGGLGPPEARRGRRNPSLEPWRKQDPVDTTFGLPTSEEQGTPFSSCVLPLGGLCTAGQDSQAGATSSLWGAAAALPWGPCPLCVSGLSPLQPAEWGNSAPSAEALMGSVPQGGVSPQATVPAIYAASAKPALGLIQPLLSHDSRHHVPTSQAFCPLLHLHGPTQSACHGGYGEL